MNNFEKKISFLRVFFGVDFKEIGADDECAEILGSREELVAYVVLCSKLRGKKNINDALVSMASSAPQVGSKIKVEDIGKSDYRHGVEILHAGLMNIIQNRSDFSNDRNFRDSMKKIFYSFSDRSMLKLSDFFDIG